MNREDRVRHIGQWLEEVSPHAISIRTCTQGPLAERNWPVNDTQPDMSLERIEASLAQAYLAANLRSRNIPLKEFMDDFEKRILVSCLRLAQGNQKNVAAVLSLKPTSLFEKLRKHGISPRRAKPREALARPPPRRSPENMAAQPCPRVGLWSYFSALRFFLEPSAPAHRVQRGRSNR